MSSNILKVKNVKKTVKQVGLSKKLNFQNFWVLLDKLYN